MQSTCLECVLIEKDAKVYLNCAGQYDSCATHHFALALVNAAHVQVVWNRLEHFREGLAHEECYGDPVTTCKASSRCDRRQVYLILPLRTADARARQLFVVAMDVIVRHGKDDADKATLAVSDPKLGGLIKEKLDIKCVFDNTILELMRGIRGQLESLVTGLSSETANAMKLGLSHSLCRYKLKFSPDKVDTMITQVIAQIAQIVAPWTSA